MLYFIQAPSKKGWEKLRKNRSSPQQYNSNTKKQAAFPSGRLPVSVKGEEKPYNSPEGYSSGKKHGVKDLFNVKILAQMIQEKTHSSVANHEERPHKSSLACFSRELTKKKGFCQKKGPKNTQSPQGVVKLHGIAKKRRRVEGEMHAPR
jgi:hypothetical protein